VDLTTLAAVMALAATAALIQALSGFGFSLFIVPFLALLIGPKDTVVLANLLSTFSNSVQATILRQSANRRTAGVLTLGSLVGMPFGLLILLTVDATALKLCIAGAVLFFTLLLMRGVEFHRAGRIGDAIAGVTSGVLNTSTSMSGPPVVLYLQGRGMPPLEFRATICTFFLVTSAVAVGLLLATGTVKPYLFFAFAVSLPAVFFGQRLGNRLFHRVNAILFRRMVYAILLLSGGVAILGALAG
jgi:uncharacterized membrane protein YfcA